MNNEALNYRLEIYVPIPFQEHPILSRKALTQSSGVV